MNFLVDGPASGITSLYNYVNDLRTHSEKREKYECAINETRKNNERKYSVARPTRPRDDTL